MADITTECGWGKCEDCGKVWRAQDVTPLSQIKRLGERLEPGHEVPIGACSTCGAFCYGLAHACSVCQVIEPSPK